MQLPAAKVKSRKGEMDRGYEVSAKPTKPKSRFRCILPLIASLLFPPFTAGCSYAIVKKRDIIGMIESYKSCDDRSKQYIKSYIDCSQLNKEFFRITKERGQMLKNIRMKQFYDIERDDIDAAETDLKKLFGVKEISKIPRTTDTMFTIFDRIAKIKYKTESFVMKRPAETLKRGEGDCDDKAIALALMLNLVFPDSTRILTVEEKGKPAGHAYLQFDIVMIPEIRDLITKEKDPRKMPAFFAGKMSRRYKISEEVAYARFTLGLEYSSQGWTIVSGEAKQALPRLWLPLDATMNMPGGAENKGRYTRIRAIYYQNVKRLRAKGKK